MAFFKIENENLEGSYVISVSPNSQSINFGADFIRTNNLEKAKYVNLYLDCADFIRIGFSFHEKKVDRHCLKLSNYEKVDSKIVIARKFFNKILSQYIDWKLYKKRQYLPKKEINEKYNVVIYYIKLQRNDFLNNNYDMDYDEINE